MSKYVPDILSRRWVIVSPQRLGRPDDNKKTKKKTAHLCPFCPGHEKMTPPEVLRYGKGEPNKPGWLVRVIPNKFAITDYHEVFIHTPSCRLEMESLSLSHLELIFKAYRERFNFYRKKGQVIIFCNHREHAGASLKHSHSQLVVLPFQINMDTLSREPLANIVQENKFFVTYCPDFSQWPYEIWITPKKENLIFGDITDEEIKDLVAVFQKTLKSMEKIYKSHNLSNIPFAYNFYIYPKENWYLRIIPRFVYRAGFELGTGLSVNIVDPAEAAKQYREKEDKMALVLKKLKKY
jgi:UDPglucose--hexose-1-phosphate uridylyltransferase